MVYILTPEEKYYKRRIAYNAFISLLGSMHDTHFPRKITMLFLANFVMKRDLIFPSKIIIITFYMIYEIT